MAVFEERGEPVCGRAANYGGLFSPPSAAKFVRTIFNIEHISVKVNDLWAASRSLPRTELVLVRGSAAKLNGNFQQKLNF
ncbi:MAG: hypothetical protein COV41_01540 [Candidatus Brennerbacteria bacterium CG11_big_fil_rev_8_21_14_0_20_43_10]|uniref:Uncharacterized protein n=1 Tax=Candidatus Brennerbacteria bacterium CG11_big_fil_rev_8_21_14_0_20_43_10 TaxID=1974523 RepID=A0A2H0PWI3_9BACT|nr:MAG: hypothetical protein COV41_01540 [Candidatus Brennerbacteria bacterium CG11_big_fil_rev_8_21_14_0_20_43_10]